MLKICLIGYGQMGKLIKYIATKNDCQIVSIIDPILNNKIDEENLKDCDVCIDFTAPDFVKENIIKIAKFKKNIVIGTTSWYSEITKIREIAEKNNIGIIYGSNFSLGMNLFFKIVEQTTQIMNNSNDYDVFGYEIHHHKKVDSPSGTAKQISNIILENIKNKNIAQYEKLDRKIHNEEFHFSSIRGGNVPGIHSICFDSPADTIELKHTARNREGLALGALKAAHWIKNKTGLYEFSSVFSEILEI
ncbi:MAG: 4-hydroxy-tetrahydrodipicolinate reductase [Candidatus Cloacimonetes bacterium]|nr:4-hydroxy-tetrahydrodipicolinate reductase [Candidatus Cloacimonadota bacterium]